ncbi:hypothetical protein QR97_02140 [Streptomyces sp. PBH53]|uniref:hypothetical protein n=1 Tax=Streptomyces sp. PBH53 TaxID=1577075 RepID=UPI000655552C|nr:hypothetical protein [Streptomyces sp. PBH53]AKN68761.1 hypothetical protein QR97_02140 [Streptomyces sp. PBH53]
MATTRARKTAAAKAAPEDTATEAPAPADNTPAAPDAAPLEPPHVDEAPEPPAPTPYVTPTEVIPDDENLADVILDDATGQPPANIDAVFVPLTPFGSTLHCTARLVERTFLGPHRNPVTRLLQPKGAVVSEQIAARIRERLLAQAARATGSNQ